MPGDGAPDRAAARPRRRPALALVAVLAALTALSWWLSGRWLERPGRQPDGPAARPSARP